MAEKRKSLFKSLEFKDMDLKKLEKESYKEMVKRKNLASR